MLETLIRFLITIILVYIAGKLFQQLNLPAILGWLIAGMLVGPNILNILSTDVMNTTWYSFIATISQMIVGVMIGSSLIWDKIKKAGSDVLILTLSVIIGVLIVVGFGFGLIFSFTSYPLILAVMMAAVAMATAPAPALSVIDEYSTDGPLTRATVSMTAMNSVIVTLLFYSFISIFQSVNAGSNMSVLMTLLLMILLPMIIGFFAGYLASVILANDSSGEKGSLVFITMLILVTIIMLVLDNFIYPQPMINFILAGVAYGAGFVNFEDDEVRERTGEAFAPIQSLGLLLLILNLSAPLNPSLLVSAGLWSIIYIILRALGSWLGGFIGGKIAGSAKSVQNYIGITMLPHSGVSLVNTSVAAGALALVSPDLASFIQTVIPAAAIINEVIAVLIAKKVYELAGEVNQASDDDEDFIRENTSHRAVRPYDDSYYQNKRHPRQEELKKINH